jgi:hypothetical protein
MGAMIQCWTASGIDDPKCAQTAKMLTDCMKNLVRLVLPLRIGREGCGYWRSTQDELLIATHQLSMDRDIGDGLPRSTAVEKKKDKTEHGEDQGCDVIRISTGDSDNG